MKRKILRSFAVLAMALICGNAWAERDTSKPVYVPELNKSYDNIQEAMKAIYAQTDQNTCNIELWADISLTDRVTVKEKSNDASSNTTKYSISIVPKANVTISYGLNERAKIWFLVATGGNTLTIGADGDYKITVKGQGHESGKEAYAAVCRAEAGNMNITNVVFKDFKFDTDPNKTANKGYLYSNKDGGVLFVKNVSIDNCIANNEAFFYSTSGKDDAIYLQGQLNFTNSTGTCFDIAKRIRLGVKDGGNYDDFTATYPISVKWSSSTTAIGTSAIIKTTDNTKKYFYLTNDNLGLYRNSSNGDLKLTQAYTVETKSDAKGAATLVLPFESTIPQGVKVYKLNSVNSDNSIVTEEVKDKLSKDTPVLINTTVEGGKYKFVSTNTTANSEFATGSGTHSSGLLTGVYSETQVAAGNYILASGSKGVGFYKTKENTSKVTPYHAYLTLTNNNSSTGSSPAPAFFSIRFDDNGTTAIKGIDVEENKGENGTYNLNGVRMQNTNKKGLYIKNGKVFINQ